MQSINISKVKLATIVEGNPKAPFSIATTPMCRGGRYSFPGLLYFILDPYLIMLSVKQGGIKYHFLSLWYDSTWDWTQVSRAIGEHSNPKANHLLLRHETQKKIACPGSWYSINTKKNIHAMFLLQRMPFLLDAFVLVSVISYYHINVSYLFWDTLYEWNFCLDTYLSLFM